jgi:hypothetical protein
LYRTPNPQTVTFPPFDIFKQDLGIGGAKPTPAGQ